ncbi:hypothetical protein [Pseudoxanthomonas kalamensis]|uniref:hypothetical protein n=1 Tax=Pseudoxanthomonas kalamensis TaxID=289483 RepID=UPI001390E838|nr:hypothetical protein [Pseudoxanthomonas kalamensis]
MPDDTRPRDLPGNWSEALSALPLEQPAHSAWERLAAEIRPPRRTYRRSIGWAVAAMLALALVVPLAWRGELVPSDDTPVVATQTTDPATAGSRIPHPGADPTPARPETAARTLTAPAQAIAASEELDALYLQSAQLESLLAQARDDRVLSGPAAATSDELTQRLGWIDAALAQPALADAQRNRLWRERVDTLQQLVGFESTQRWLSTHGQTYDGQLVAVY